jgi:PPE-repeat protein
MPILGKIGQALGQVGRFYTSPEGIQNLQATLQDIANPDAQAMARLQVRRDKMAQQQQQQQAYADLMGSYRGPDMETAGVNQLIGGANETGARFGMAPMQRQEPRYQQGFDIGDPNTQSAMANFLAMGGSPADMKAIQEMGRGPKPSYFNTRSGVVAVDPETGEANEVYSDPYAGALAQRQIDAQGALAEQRRAGGRAAMIRATRPPAPRAGAAPGAAPVKSHPSDRYKGRP